MSVLRNNSQYIDLILNDNHLFKIFYFIKKNYRYLIKLLK